MRRFQQCFLFFILQVNIALSADVYITEVMYDPQYDDEYYEFVEIYNPQDSPIDLTGWRLSDGTGEDFIIGIGVGTLLSGYGVIFDPDYLNHEPLYDYLLREECLILTVEGTTLGDRGLSNTSPETIILIDSNGDTVDQYQFSIGNQPGHSDEKINIFDINTPTNWGESLYPDGTPGFNNSISPKGNNLTLSDIEFSPANPSTTDNIEFYVSVKNTGNQDLTNIETGLFVDANQDIVFSPGEMFTLLTSGFIASGDSTVLSTVISPLQQGGYLFGAVNLSLDDFPFDDTVSVQLSVGNLQIILVFNEVMYKPADGNAEWVELYNRSENEVNLFGWRLSDADILNLSDPIEGNIEPDGFMVVAEDSTIFNHPGLALNSNVRVIGKFPSLNNDGDAIYLIDPAEGVVDSVNYPADWGDVYYGTSMVRVDPFIDTGLSNWLPSADPEGSSPCAQNSVYFIQNSQDGLKLWVEPEVFFPDGSGSADKAQIKIELQFPAGTANLRIFDVRGRMVRFLVKSQYIGNSTEFEWDGRNDSGEMLRIGPYIVHVEVISETYRTKSEAKTVVVLGKQL